VRLERASLVDHDNKDLKASPTRHCPRQGSVLNNWCPGANLIGQARKGYIQTDVNTLAGLAFQARREWQPIDVLASTTGQVYRRIGYGPLLDVFILDVRSYEDPNPDDWSTSDGGGIVGARQAQWLVDSLRASSATWKVVVNDLPLGIVVPDALSIRGRGRSRWKPSPTAMRGFRSGESSSSPEYSVRQRMCTTSSTSPPMCTTPPAIFCHPDRAALQDACSRAPPRQILPACTTGRCHCNRSPLMERAMTSCWICSVPSKMSKILASRCIRSTGYSRE